MTFYENHHAMMVLDQRREVAVARPQGGYGHRQWLIKLRGASWICGGSTSAITGKQTHNHLVVKTRGEARKILKSLCHSG